MRMWNVDPAVMCQRHLLGEHVEMHMFVGTLRKGISMAGYVANGLVETQHIERRHTELVAEMVKRGMNHQSPLSQPVCSSLGTVDPSANLFELARRCPECAALQKSCSSSGVGL